MLASIPSPSESVIELGPLTLRAYGVMIAFGVVAAVLLSQRRWTARGGNPDDISTIALWAVPAGLIGARAYHVLTDWRFDEGWAQPFKIWEGGLGIPGGIAAGVLVGLWMIRRNGWDQPTLLDAIPLAPAHHRQVDRGEEGERKNRQTRICACLSVRSCLLSAMGALLCLSSKA